MITKWNIMQNLLVGCSPTYSMHQSRLFFLHRNHSLSAKAYLPYPPTRTKLTHVICLNRGRRPHHMKDIIYQSRLSASVQILHCPFDFDASAHFILIPVSDLCGPHFHFIWTLAPESTQRKCLVHLQTEV